MENKKIDLRNKGIEVLDLEHGQLVKKLFKENGVDVYGFKFSNTRAIDSIDRFYCVNVRNNLFTATSAMLNDQNIELIELPNIKKQEDFNFSINPDNLPFISTDLDKDYTETAYFFDEVIDSTINQITNTLLVKGKEYRRNGNPFHNFEEGARKENKTREEILHGFALKHEISISDMRNDLSKGIMPKVEQVNEKFNDLIIYLLIEKASILDKLQLKNTENEN
jgi:hypothetical protein